VWLFERAVGGATELYGFGIRGLRFDGAQVSFYIKPADGFKLTDIMKWIKETFAVRFNLLDGRTGHIWGAEGRTRNVERVVVPRQHGGPLIPVLQTIRPTGPTDTRRRFSWANRLSGRRCTGFYR
jgi:hypothetical protein